MATLVSTGMLNPIPLGSGQQQVQFQLYWCQWLCVVSFQNSRIAVAIVVFVVPRGKEHGQIHFCEFSFWVFGLQTLPLSKSKSIYLTSQMGSQHEKQFSWMVPWSIKKGCRKIEKQRFYLFSEMRWATIHWGDGQIVTGNACYSIHKSLLTLPCSSFFLDPLVTIIKYQIIDEVFADLGCAEHMFLWAVSLVHNNEHLHGLPNLICMTSPDMSVPMILKLWPLLMVSDSHTGPLSWSHPHSLTGWPLKMFFSPYGCLQLRTGHWVLFSKELLVMTMGRPGRRVSNSENIILGAGNAFSFCVLSAYHFFSCCYIYSLASVPVISFNLLLTVYLKCLTKKSSSFCYETYLCPFCILVHFTGHFGCILRKYS